MEGGQLNQAGGCEAKGVRRASGLGVTVGWRAGRVGGKMGNAERRHKDGLGVELTPVGFGDS